MSAMRWVVAASMLSSVALVGANEVSEDKRALSTNFWQDINNCGWFGHACPDNDALGSPFCNNGQCGTTCDSQCFYSQSAQSCQPNVPSRCGMSGTVCSGPKSNGRASCNNGICGVSCNANTQYNAAQNDCLPIYTTSRCGLSGQTCSGPSGGNGQAYCNLGQCGITCNNGYVLDSSTRTCYKTSATSLNNCPIYAFGFPTGFRENCNTKFAGFQGGTTSCTSSGCAYTCSNGYTSSNFLSGIFGSARGCVNTSNNNSCCGSSGAVCTDPAHGSASCQSGRCVYDCDDGYDYDDASGTCKQTTTDVQNCGRCGNTCYSPPNGYAICSKGSCSFGCNNGYVPYQHTCVKSGTQRARVRARRDVPNGPQLCPAGETACPITGSASFGPFGNTQHETVLAALSSGTIGYECLDISDSLESCGGCSSMGEGQDCTKIAHAADVGCRNGQCTVLQCAKGYVLSSNGSTCTRPHKVKRNSGASHL